MLNIIPSMPECQVLNDIDARGRERPWAQHKLEASVLAAAYAAADDTAKAARVLTCADRLHYTREADGRLHLSLAQFCRVRLCPICQWRRSLKLYGQTSDIVKWCNSRREGAYSWIMLTLTQRNVDACDLARELDLIARAWQRLTQRAEVRSAVIGWMRATEITRNAQSDTYHPHIHAILCVLPSYYHSRNYISQARWSAIWAECNRLDYTPIVDVRRCYGSAEAATAEIAKYAAKPGDYLDPSDIDSMMYVVQTLDKALAHRRCAAWGGIMSEAHRALGLDDAETGDLVHTSAEAEDTQGALIAYDWTPGLRLYAHYTGGVYNG